MWEQIRKNRRRSMMLVMLIAALLIVLGYVLGEAYFRGGGPIGVLIAIVLWAILGMTAYFQGDNILLAVSGAKEIEKKDHPRLFNIVEEMTIASGLPKMPRVFIVNDVALNAFATGRSPKRAAVAVTAGLLARLNRDELQGVIAHEMSHVVNRDVLLMTIAGIMLGAIVMIADIFMRSLRFSGRGARYRSSRGGGQGQAILFVIAIVLAIVSPILAQLLYLAISRRREYLADANAVVLTRYPPGLAAALEAISADPNVPADANKATAPMYISNPFRRQSLSRWTSTHPPIEERIRILRAMGGQASYAAYDKVYREVHRSRSGVIPPSTLGIQADLTARGPSEETTAAVDPRALMREAGDLVRKLNDFVFVTCQCGLKLKLPPEYRGKVVRCPKCGRSGQV